MIKAPSLGSVIKAEIVNMTQHPNNNLIADQAPTMVQHRSKGPCDVFDPWVRWERGQVGI